MARDFFSLNPDQLDPSKGNLPLLLLDIDGVVNAYAYRPAITVLPDDAFNDLEEFMINTMEGRSFTFWTSPTLIAALNALHESGEVEIAWLTTWQYQANPCVSPVLGLPQWPVAADQAGRFSDYYWKPRAAVEALQLKRPIIWIDDAEVGQAERDAFANSKVPHLIIEPCPEYGLLPSHLTDIDRFIASL